MNEIDNAAACLQSGGVIAHATEGVWGLACDPYNDDAVRRILAIKGREAAKGMLLIGGGPTDFQAALEELTPKIMAQVLASWPGHVTWLLPGDAFPQSIKGQHSTIACRVPDHAQARGIASAFGSAMRGEDKKAESEITGATPDKLDPTHGRLIGELDLQQKRTTGDIRWIQEDLGHFHARTQKDIHKELIDDMKDYNIDNRLETLRQEISKNQSFISAVRSKQLAEKLRDWAKKLEGDKDGGDGSGEGGGGESQEEKDFEFMLKVMRMVQTEQDIRSRTRSLEQMLRSLNLRKQPN